MSAIATLVPQHGGQLHALAKQFGLPVEELIDFSASISPHAQPPQVMQRLAAAVSDPEFLRVYPDIENCDLKEAIASYCPAPPEAISVANGVMPLLTSALQALSLKRCLIVAPCFSGYAAAMQAALVRSEVFALRPEYNFAFESDRVISAATHSGCDAILLANPHSPSGVLTQRDVLESFCEQAADAGITVLLDEAFIDFEPEASLASLTAASSHLVVFRSLTKFFAVPAMRVAYALANRETTVKIASSLPAWPISSIAAVAGRELLQLREHHALIREQNRIGRNALFAELQNLPLKVFPSRANFLLLQLANAERGLALWRSLIIDHGVVLRSCQNFSLLNASYLRAGIRSPQDNATLLRALQRAIAS